MTFPSKKLTCEIIEAWPDEIVGYVRQALSCPLAAVLGSVGFNQPVVRGSLWGDGEADRSAPMWVGNFVLTIDQLPPNHPVTKAEALAALGCKP